MQSALMERWTFIELPSFVNLKIWYLCVHLPHLRMEQLSPFCIFSYHPSVFSSGLLSVMFAIPTCQEEVLEVQHEPSHEDGQHDLATFMVILILLSTCTSCNTLLTESTSLYALQISCA